MTRPARLGRPAIAAALDEVRLLVDKYASAERSGRERALVLTKLDEAELWLGRCAMRDEPAETL